MSDRTGTARAVIAAALFVVPAATILLAPGPARACDLCAIYTGSLMQEEQTGLVLGIAEQYTDFGTVRVDGEKVANEGGEWVHSSITQLIAGWGITPRIGVQAHIPLITREFRRLEDGHAMRGDEAGLGDISLIGRAAPVSRMFGETLLHVELFAGLKLPTGDTDRLFEEKADHEEEGGGEEDDGEHHGAGFRSGVSAPGGGGGRHDGHLHPSAVHGHDLTLGSGSVDGLFGFTVHASWKRIFGSIAVQYAVRGNGDAGYEYANDLTWELSPGAYLFVHHDWTAALSFVASGENKGRDHQGGQLVDDTAITAVYLGPGFEMTFGDNLHADLVVDLPVEQDTTGRQITADYRFRGGLIWRF